MDMPKHTLCTMYMEWCSCWRSHLNEPTDELKELKRMLHSHDCAQFSIYSHQKAGLFFSWTWVCLVHDLKFIVEHSQDDMLYDCCCRCCYSGCAWVVWKLKFALEMNVIEKRRLQKHQNSCMFNVCFLASKFNPRAATADVKADAIISCRHSLIGGMAKVAHVKLCISVTVTRYLYRFELNLRPFYWTQNIRRFDVTSISLRLKEKKNKTEKSK